jgi:hypothetical protein
MFTLIQARKIRFGAGCFEEVGKEEAAQRRWKR